MRVKIQEANSLKNISLAVVFDQTEQLERNLDFPFPPDAEAEWETQQTVDKISEVWTALGCRVTQLPLDKNFLHRWARDHGSFDLVHPLVEGWGSVAREGWIPSLCELSGVPYIGSGPVAQNIAMKKSFLKTLCHELSIPTARHWVVATQVDLEQLPDDAFQSPHFLKPDCEGSGMGIHRAHSIGQSPDASRKVCLELLEKYPDGVLVEELLTGRELTSAMIADLDASALPIAEIEVPGGVYGLSYKGKDAMEEKVSFPELPETTKSIIHNAMESLKQRLGFDDFVRLDWKLDANGTPHLLEANPLAGLSYYYSVLPKMAERAGLSYQDFLGRLGISALSRKNHRKLWYGRSRVRNEGPVEFPVR